MQDAARVVSCGIAPAPRCPFPASVPVAGAVCGKVGVLVRAGCAPDETRVHGVRTWGYDRSYGGCDRPAVVGVSSAVIGRGRDGVSAAVSGSVTAGVSPAAVAVGSWRLWATQAGCHNER